MWNFVVANWPYILGVWIFTGIYAAGRMFGLDGQCKCMQCRNSKINDEPNKHYWSYVGEAYFCGMFGPFGVFWVELLGLFYTGTPWRWRWPSWRNWKYLV